MYLYLLHQCNIRRWINPFEFKTRDLELMLGLSRNSIGAIRNSLKQRGFINFTKGVGSGSGAYLICGVEITNPELYKKFCVKSEDTKVNTILNTKVNTTVNTTVNTNADSTLYNEEKRNKTKDNPPGGGARARKKRSARDGLFSEKELAKSEEKGIRASQLAKFSAPTIEDVKNSFLAYGADTRISDWETEAIALFSYYNSQGWVKSNGNEVSNWESLVVDWILRREKEQKRTKHNEPNTTYRRYTPEETLADEQARLARRIYNRRGGPNPPGDSADDSSLPF